MSFQGFGEAALSFWDGLAEDNSSTYWKANRPVFDRAIAEPLAALAQDLTAEFGDIHRFRPQRDVRFSPDKRPYAEQCSMLAQSNHPTGGALYFQFGPGGVMIAGGAWRPATPVLTAFREAVDDPDVAAEFDRTLAGLRAQGFDFDGDPLRTAPRGWPRDHPRIDLLRMRNLALHRDFEVQPWIFSAEGADRVRQTWRGLETWNGWLGATIGSLGSWRRD